MYIHIYIPGLTTSVLDTAPEEPILLISSINCLSSSDPTYICLASLKRL